MLIVELEADDLDYRDKSLVRLGKVTSAIIRANNKKHGDAPNKVRDLDKERKLFPLINAAVELGKLHPIDPETTAPMRQKADYFTFGVVDYSELVKWGRTDDRYDFIISTVGAVVEQQEIDKREHGRYTLEEAALFIGKQTGERAEGIKNKLIAAVEKRELVTYAPGSFVKNDSKITRDFYEHVYWNDLNEWLEKNEPRLDCEFPKPDAPAAKVKAGTTPGNDWKEKAHTIADELALKKYQRGEREITARNISDAVATELAKDSTTHGIRGERSAGSIRNQALKGWKFIPPTGTNGTSGTKK